MIDPETRDVVQTVYIRKVEKVNGGLYNVEFDKYPGSEGSGQAVTIVAAEQTPPGTHGSCHGSPGLSYATGYRRVSAGKVSVRVQGGPSSRAPHLARRFDHQAHLRRLRVARDIVAVHRAGEAALRRQAKLVERDALRGLVDLALERVLGFEFVRAWW